MRAPLRAATALVALLLSADAHAQSFPGGGSGGSGITGPGTTVSGNIATWNSTTGAAIADSTYAFGTAGSTVCLVNGNCTFSGAVTHSGTTTFSGVFANSPAANTTLVGGGTITPTPGANAGILMLGGVYTWPTLVSGQGAMNLSATYGEQLGGFGSSCDVTLFSYGGSIAFCVTHGTQNVSASGRLTVGAALLSGGTVPTTNTGGCTTIGAATGGAMAGKFTTTASCGTGTTIILSGLSGAATGYTCDLHDITTRTSLINQTNQNTTSVTFTVDSVATGTTDTIVYKCMGW